MRAEVDQESRAIEGDSPVSEAKTSLNTLPSITGSGKAGVNLPGPSGKAKYYSVTDSEEYREGKVKRIPRGK